MAEKKADAGRVAPKRVASRAATKKECAMEANAIAVLPPLRPSQCRAYMRRELAREFRGIVQGFVNGAKKGSCQHVKLATELVGSPGRRSARGKSTVRRLIEEMESGRGRGE